MNKILSFCLLLSILFTGCKQPGSETSDRETADTALQSEQSTVEGPRKINTTIRQQNGKPAHILDGKDVYAGHMWTSLGTEDLPNSSSVKGFAEAGIHNYAFDIGPEVWCGPGDGRNTGQIPQDHFDFSGFEERLQRIIDMDPKAHFHFRVYLEKVGAENWWVKMYPDQLEVTELTEEPGYESSETVTTGIQPSVSFASVVWQSHAKTFLRTLVGHMKEIEMDERVVAYQIGYGYCQETFKWSAVGPYIGDFSEPMQDYFRKWLREYYNNDVKAMKEAWADPGIEFETATVPSMKQQLNTGHGTFRDVSKEQDVIDYYRCYADLDSDVFIEFCKVVKEENGEAALTGGFYGYIYDRTDSESFWHWGTESHLSGLQRSGHLGLKKVLNSPYIDFLVSPYSYFFRSIGGECAAMMPTESLRLHNKMYILEDDTRTYLNPDDPTCGRTYTKEASTAVLQRNFAQSLIRRWGTWWLGAEGHIQGEIFTPLLTQFRQLGQWALQFDAMPSSEIAVLIDEESMLYGSIQNELYQSLTTNQRVWGMPHIGAPADYYLLDDFIEGRVPPAKLYIFLNAFALDQERRDKLSEELHRDGRTALWIYAPGYIKDDLSIDNMTELTGFKFVMNNYTWEPKSMNKVFAWGPRMHITNFAHPITQDLTEDLYWGTTKPIGPLFYLEDNDAEDLGEIVLSVGICKPGFGLKTFDNWNSIFVSTPDIPAPVLRGIARYAGVHLYNEEGDVLSASSEFIAVHTKGGGERTLKLPQKAEVVYDLYNSKKIADNVSEFTVTLPPKSTTLYYFGDREALETLK